jgi:hypothetical protein
MIAYHAMLLVAAYVYGALSGWVIGMVWCMVW